MIDATLLIVISSTLTIAVLMIINIKLWDIIIELREIIRRDVEATK